MVSQMSMGSATMLRNTFGESSITFQVSGGVYMHVHAQYLCDVFILWDILLSSIAYTFQVQCINIMIELMNIPPGLVKFQTLCQVLSYAVFYCAKQ